MPARWRPSTGGRALLPRPKPKPPQPRAPSTGAPAAPTGLPVDPAYDAATGAASFNYQTAALGAQYQRGQLGQSYGLGIRPDGSVFDDVSNPYSRAAEQQKAYDRARRGTTTSLAAQGQLYAGSMQNAQNENANVANRNRDALIRDFMGAQQGITEAERGARGQYFGAVAEAEAAQIARGLANRPLPAQVTAPPAPKPKPKPKVKPKGKK